MLSRNSIPDTPSRIVLVGFMGAGKSTAGPILAERLGWRFLDSDQHLEQKHGSTVAALFATFGETGFRQREAEVVAELHHERALVLALGGGALESEATRQLLLNSPDTCMVFLKAPLEVLIDRCQRQPGAAVRPLLHQREMLCERFHSRQMHYEAAHVTVNTHRIPPREVVDAILTSLQGRLATVLPVVKAVSI